MRKAIACVGFCLVAGARADAAQWLFTPSARVATTYVDNPRLLPDGGTASEGVLGEFSATLQRRTERSDVTWQPRVQSARVEADESLNSDDQYLDIRANYRTERSHWSGALGFVRDTTLTSELASTGLVQANRRHQSITFSGGPTWLASERMHIGAQAYVLDSRYPEPGDTALVDYQYRLMSLFTAFNATERTDWRLTVQVAELVAPDALARTRDGSARLAWQFKPDALWTTKVSAGPARVEAQAGDDSGAVFDADVERQADRWSMTLHAGRNLTPTGRGVLTRRDRAVVSFNRQLTPFVSGGLSAQWVRNQDLLRQPGIQFARVDYGRLDLNLSWRFAENWSLTLGAGGATQSYEDSGDVDSWRASIGIVWTRQQSL